MKTMTCTFRLSSNFHDHAVVSWWAAHTSGTDRKEVVGEESGHRLVWGIQRSSDEEEDRSVSVPWIRDDQTQSKIRVSSVAAGEVVGTGDEPALLVDLVIKCPADIDIAHVVARAKQAYDAEFVPTYGTLVYYTRRTSPSTVVWKLFGTMPTRGIETVIMQRGLATDIMADVRRFMGERAAYERAGRPYKRVYCLHGPPGTGKTSVVTAVAGELRAPLAIFNVDSLRDDLFIELLSTLPSSNSKNLERGRRPTIDPLLERGCRPVLLFEDVDAMFEGRNKSEASAGMSFSTLLNALDGVLHPSGCLIFLTTNHLERLDAAMHRPGRVDRLIEVPYSTPDQRVAMWRTVFPDGVPPPPSLSHPTPGIAPSLLSALLFQMRDDAAAKVVAAVDKLMLGAAAVPKHERFE